jgi:hypothetical protein
MLENREKWHSAEKPAMLAVIVLALLGFWVYNHWSKPATWTAIYYPNASARSKFTTQPVDSLQACRDWVETKASNSAAYAYECGKDCTHSAPGKVDSINCKITLE